MADLFASGRIADLILALMAIEAVALLIYCVATGRRSAMADVLPNLAAGACLILALRGALISAPWPMIASALAGALVSHLVDMYRRLYGPRS